MMPLFSQQKEESFEPYIPEVFLEKGKAFDPCDPEK